MIDLQAIHDSRNSFYGKAKIDNSKRGILQLYSYKILVSQIQPSGARVFNTQSQTTIRHIKEFLKQNGFRVENTAQIIKDYKEYIKW